MYKGNVLKHRIEETLAEIENSEEVRILYACESGSRAWGFASKDSDYDVRFIYLHPPEWYLSVDLEHRRDVIERPIVDELDVGGWDIRKALYLFRKSNPPLVEWLGSPIVYHEPFQFASRLRALLSEYYSVAASGYHYLHMARGNYREYLKGEIVWRKKYFYVLRPILAIKWLEAGNGVVPTEFGKLVDIMVPAGSLRSAIEALIEEKSRGGEQGRGPRIEELNSFLSAELDRLENSKFAKELSRPGFESLNDLFRKTMKEVYGDT